MGFSFQNNSQFLDFSYKMDLFFLWGRGIGGLGLLRKGKTYCSRKTQYFYQISIIYLNSDGISVLLYFRRTQLESEEIVADLVHCFLIPEVKKKTVREKGITLWSLVFMFQTIFFCVAFSEPLPLDTNFFVLCKQENVKGSAML